MHRYSTQGGCGSLRVVGADGKSSLHGRTDEVLVRRSAFSLGGAAQEQGAMRRPAGCEHPGLHSHGQYPAVRDVQFIGQPDGGCRNCGGTWRVDAHALFTDDGGSLDAGCADGVDRRRSRVG